jgi:hypothetical protein
MLTWQKLNCHHQQIYPALPRLFTFVPLTHLPPVRVDWDTMEDYYLPNLIFEFPSEILQRILFFSIISRLKYDEEEPVRGTSRVLILRLVCSKICRPFLEKKGRRNSLMFYREI